MRIPPTPEQIKAGIAGVFDRAAPTYDRVGVDFFAPVGRFLVSRTNPVTGERVLDVGCGRGASALPAAEVVGPTGEVVAIDLARCMVEQLRLSAAEVPWLRAEVGDAEAPPPGPFDVVQAGLVLFFLPDLDAALARYRQVLNPSGRLGFTWFGEPDRGWEPVFDALVAEVPKDQIGPDPGSGGPFGSVESLHAYLAEHGWTNVSTETMVHEARVRDADHWFEWAWSQGYRHLLERLETLGLLESAQERAAVVLSDLAAREGGLSWRAEVRATVAHP